MLPSGTMTPTVKAKVAAGQGTTPAMRQYLEAKRQYPDALIFFRMGDFYEMFYEDAVTAAGVLELTLTSRSRDRGGREIPMCGVPWHAADTYLARLVKQGFRVAVCEQVEDPRKARGIVRREVVRVVSPGTYTDAGALEASEPAFIVAVARGGDAASAVFGLATADLSTGELRVTEHRGDSSAGAAVDELAAVRPREILLPGDLDAACLPGIEHVDVPITAAEPALFDLEQALQTLLGQLGTASLDGFGLLPDRHPAAIRAAGGLVRHLRDTQRTELEHLRTLEFRTRADHLVVDAATFEHLEVLAGAEGHRAGSLLAEIDLTNTPMGGRMLRAWLQRPLAAREPERNLPKTHLPRMYSCHELARLFGKIQESRKKALKLDELTFRTLLWLLYGTGLRIGEALRLTMADVDLNDAVVTVRRTKFNKSRMVPLGDQLCEVMRSFAEQRMRRKLPEQADSSFLADLDGTPLRYRTVKGAFQKLLAEAQIQPAGDGIQSPNLHSFRHTFAVNRVTAWFRNGDNVQQLLPALSACLGHASPEGTRVYLSMTPDLLREASLRFDKWVNGDCNE